MIFRKYQEAIDFIFTQLPMYQRVGVSAYKADLANIIKMLDLLDNPQHKFKSIHIAGTNGKGSTANMLSAILQAEGYSVGLYTSPHLIDFRERIRLNGVMIPKKEVLNFVNTYHESFYSIKPTFFEWTVALCFYHFAQQKIDFGVIETGLGGRLDSTNVITPLLSIITNIGLDHTHILGDTVEKIAIEKAGIIKPKVPVVISTTQAKVESIFSEMALEKASPICFADQKYAYQVLATSYTSNDILISNYNTKEVLYTRNQLIGRYQEKNTLGVVASVDALRAQGFKISNASIQQGLENVRSYTNFTGRWHIEKLKPLTILDTGHNKEGIVEVVAQLQETPHKKLHWVFGVVADKSIDDVLEVLPREAHYYICQANIPRALAKDVLFEKMKGYGFVCSVYDTVQDAYISAQEHANSSDLVLVAGSNFTVAEVLVSISKKTL